MRAEKFLSKGNTALSKKHYSTALKYFLQAANLGDAEGHLQAGLLFLKDIKPKRTWLWDLLGEKTFNPQDFAQSHLILALQASHPTAYAEFQHVLANGLGSSRSFTSLDKDELFSHALKIEIAEGPIEAWKFFVKAADLGHTESQFKIAKEAKTSSIEISRLSSRNTEYRNNMGQILKACGRKNAVHQDINIAEKYYAMAANNGHLESQFSLIEIFINDRKRDLDGRKSDHYFKLIKRDYESLDSSLKSKFSKLAEKQKEFFESIRDNEKVQFYSEIVANLTPDNPTIASSDSIGQSATKESFFEKAKRSADTGDRNSQLSVAETYKQENKFNEALHYYKLAFFNTDPSEMKANPTGEPGHESGLYREIIQKRIDSLEQLIREQTNPHSPTMVKKSSSDSKPNELVQIFEKFASDSQYNITKDAILSLRKHFDLIHSTKDKDLDDASTVRNLFDDIVKRQSARILREGLTDRNSLNQIRFEDLAL